MRPYIRKTYIPCMKTSIKTGALSFLLIFLTAWAFAQSEYTTLRYETPVLIDHTNADSITSFENTPASVVTFFYASKIRGDARWEEVLPKEAERSERLKRKLLTYQTWKITQFKLLGKTEYAKEKLWLKIFMEIEYQGRKDSGEDDVTIEYIDGTWVITSIPT